MRADGYNVSTFENTANKNLVAMTRRFPAPWSVRELEHAFRVEDVNGQAVAYTYFRRLDTRACSTHDEARRIAAKGAYLLDLVNGLIAHVRCDVNSARRVKNIAQVRFAPDSGPQAHHRGLSAKCQDPTSSLCLLLVSLVAWGRNQPTHIYG